MSLEIFEMVKELNRANVETKLALQCAPVITGIKLSNLLIIPNENKIELERALAETGLIYYRMLRKERGITYLIFRKQELEEYLKISEVREFFYNNGYADLSFGKVLYRFQKRYEEYMLHHKNFPHEMGLLLGYPIEDVKGFIENNGENFLYSGYWKVYEKLELKREIFNSYEVAMEEVIHHVAKGMSIKDVAMLYQKQHLLAM